MYAWTILGSLIIGVAAYLLLSGFVRTYRKYRGVRLITCPENLEPAAVRVAALDAAKWFAVAGEADPHLGSCSRWPEMAGCGQECLAQIESSADGCRVQSIVGDWYDGKECHFCGKPIHAIVWHERPPAVELEDGTTREWKEIAAQDLPRVFATGLPVCWACHMVESFRHEHPDMVVQRPHDAVPQHTLPPSSAMY